MTSDFLFYANVQHDIGKTEPSLKYLSEFVIQNPKLDKSERCVFGLIFKDAIDPIRNDLRVFKAFIANESESSDIIVFLQDYYNKSLDKLNNRCFQALDLIKTLVEYSKSESAKVFFHKMAGDVYRYMNEFDESNKKLTANALHEYNKAISIANTSLPCDHPVRLGTILNYAVFLFEQCKDREKAIEIVKSSLSEVENNTTTLSLSNKKETIDIIDTMQKNLEYWAPVSSSDYDYDGNEYDDN